MDHGGLEMAPCQERAELEARIKELEENTEDLRLKNARLNEAINMGENEIQNLRAKLATAGGKIDDLLIADARTHTTINKQKEEIAKLHDIISKGALEIRDLKAKLSLAESRDVSEGSKAYSDLEQRLHWTQGQLAEAHDAHRRTVSGQSDLGLRLQGAYAQIRQQRKTIARAQDDIARAARGLGLSVKPGFVGKEEKDVDDQAGG